jgi:hypothetical protein
MVSVVMPPRVLRAMAFCGVAALCFAPSAHAANPFALRGIAPMWFLENEIGRIADAVDSAKTETEKGSWRPAAAALSRAQRELEEIRPRVGEGKSALEKFGDAEARLADHARELALAWMATEVSRAISNGRIVRPEGLLPTIQGEIDRVVDVVQEFADIVERAAADGPLPTEFTDDTLLAHLRTGWRKPEDGGNPHARKLLWLSLVSPGTYTPTPADVSELLGGAADDETAYLAGLALLGMEDHEDDAAELRAMQTAERYMSQAAKSVDRGLASRAQASAAAANLRQLELALGSVDVDEEFWRRWHASLGSPKAPIPLVELGEILPGLGAIPAGLTVAPEGSDGLGSPQGMALAAALTGHPPADASLLVGWLCSGLGLQEWARPHLEGAQAAAGSNDVRSLRIAYMLGRATEDSALPAPLPNHPLYAAVVAAASNRTGTAEHTGELTDILADVRRYYTGAVARAGGIRSLPGDVVEQVDYMARWLAADEALGVPAQRAKLTTGQTVRAAIHAARLAPGSFSIRLRCFRLLRPRGRYRRRPEQLSVLVYGAVGDGTDPRPHSGFYEIASDQDASPEVGWLVQAIGLAQFLHGVDFPPGRPLRIVDLVGTTMDAGFLRDRFLTANPYSSLVPQVQREPDWGIVAERLYDSAPTRARVARDASGPAAAVSAHTKRAREFVEQHRYMLGAREYMKSYMLVPTAEATQGIGDALEAMDGGSRP